MRRTALIIIILLLAVTAAGCITTEKTTPTQTTTQPQPNVIITTTKTTTTTTVTTITSPAREVAIYMGKTYTPAGAVAIDENGNYTIIPNYTVNSTIVIVPATAYYQMKTVESYKLTLNGTVITGAILPTAYEYTINGTPTTKTIPDEYVPPQLLGAKIYVISGTTYLPLGKRLEYWKNKTEYTIIAQTATLTASFTEYTRNPLETIIESPIKGFRAISFSIKGKYTTVYMPEELTPIHNFITELIKLTPEEEFQTIPPTTALDKWASIQISFEAKYPAPSEKECAEVYAKAIWELGGVPTVGVIDNSVFFVITNSIVFYKNTPGIDYNYFTKYLYYSLGQYTMTLLIAPYGGQTIVKYVTVSSASPLPIIYTGGNIVVTETLYTTLQNLSVLTNYSVYTINDGTVTAMSINSTQTFTTTGVRGPLPIVYRLTPIYHVGNNFFAPHVDGLVIITAAAAYNGGVVIATYMGEKATLRVVYTISTIS